MSAASLITSSNALEALIAKKRRRTAGIMSGTSLDGVDVVIADLEGSGRLLSIDVLATHFQPYPEDLVSLLLANSKPESSSVRDISQLNVRLSEFYAEAVNQTCASFDSNPSELDLVGCHGQTVYHVPDPEVCAGSLTTSTLQLGDGSVLANRLGVPAVTNFRSADMALGGQGAPLVPYFDYIRFSVGHENRVLLNLGGIANLTVLRASSAGSTRHTTPVQSGDSDERDASPEARQRANRVSSGSASDVMAFDTGPANMLMNYVAQRWLGTAYDIEGKVAAAGKVNTSVLAELLADPYYTKRPPKSTGRELYNSEFADRFESLMRDANDDSVGSLMATALELTVESIARALEQFVYPTVGIDRVLVSGGGAQNPTLMRRLAERLSPVPVRTLASVGVDPDFKEALCFAVLAHEFVNGTPTNLPSVTGASHPTILGELALARSGPTSFSKDSI